MTSSLSKRAQPCVSAPGPLDRAVRFKPSRPFCFYVDPRARAVLVFVASETSCGHSLNGTRKSRSSFCSRERERGAGYCSGDSLGWFVWMKTSHQNNECSFCTLEVGLKDVF